MEHEPSSAFAWTDETVAEQARLLTTHAELIDRDVEHLARAVYSLVGRLEAEGRLDDENGDLDWQRWADLGLERLVDTLAATVLRLRTAEPSQAGVDYLRARGFTGFAIDDHAVYVGFDELEPDVGWSVHCTQGDLVGVYASTSDEASRIAWSHAAEHDGRWMRPRRHIWSARGLERRPVETGI